ncbi:MAG: hypothetical protein VX117_01145 [Candidatus Thermoplasmatota archaeon]|nr:hypothetical protein [Candidatus Thermoplasmatota archaeon]
MAEESGSWIDSELFTLIIIGMIIFYFMSLMIKNAYGLAFLRNSTQQQKSLKVIDPHALQRVKHDIMQSCKASLPRGPSKLWLTGSRHVSRVFVGHIEGINETNSIRWFVVKPTKVKFSFFSIPLSYSRLIAVHKDYCSHPTSPDIFIKGTSINLHADAFWVPSYIDDYDKPITQSNLLSMWDELIMDWKVWMLRFQHIVQTDLGPRLLVRAMNPSIADRAKEIYPGGPVREMEVNEQTGGKYVEPPKPKGGIR